jgi:biotin carboxylase
VTRHDVRTAGDDAAKPSVLVPWPAPRDVLNLVDPGLGSRFEVVTPPPGVHDSDPALLVDRVLADPVCSAVEGVFGSQDAGAHLAVTVASRLGLPGPTPERFMRCHDKLASREWQRKLVPEATPGFFALEVAADADGAPGLADLPLPFPLFVKPVTAHLSQLAFIVRDQGELDAVMVRARKELDAITWFDSRLAGRPFRTMIAEELLTGRQVTFEWFMSGGRLTPIGVTDSIMHPNGISFLRFDYPSTLPDPLQSRIVELTERLMAGIGFEGSLFNVEFFVSPDGDLRIIEANGRMASQFAPLVKAVHGVSTYELGFELAAGGSPVLPPARPDLVASSFVLREFAEDAVVRAVPDPADVLERYPHAQVELLVHPGQRLSENEDDEMSHRLALVALAGPTREAVLERYDVARAMLRFELEPVAPGG